MKTRREFIARLVAVVFIFGSLSLAVQGQKLDRTKVPEAGKTPELHVPAWTKTQLANGATLIVSERHNLPLVSFSMTFVGGSNQFEPANRRGVASMTASMLTEGTTTKTGDQISDALQMLGTGINTRVGGEDGSM